MYQEKVLLIKAIKEQKDHCLAMEQVQVWLGWLGMAQIFRITGLPDITQKYINLDKTQIMKAMKVSHLMHLKEEMKGFKLETMKNSVMRTRRSYKKWSLKMCRLVGKLAILLQSKHTK